MLAVASLLLGGAAGASAATLCVNPSGQGGCMTSISAAVQAASAGDTIQVAPGTYTEDVMINKSLSLVAMTNAQPVIDATNQPNGIYIDGMAAAPGIGVWGVVVSGFQIKNAQYEGILVQNASDVTLVGNYVHDNDRLLDISSGTCDNIPGFETNEGFDCGEGIHLMGSQSVTVLNNEVAYNAGGILTSDETGPSQDNLIKGNHVHDNPYDCGITMASHAVAPGLTPTAHGVSFGVMDNTIADNVSEHNGYQVPGSGAGVGIFAPGPGTIDSGNVVIGNVLKNNGQPGVAMHNHAAPGVNGVPGFLPPINLNNNKIIGNFFSGNGTDQFDGGKPTGINIYSMGPVWGTVVAQNSFQQEGIDTAFNLPAGGVSEHFNKFESGAIGMQNMGAATVDATENWWNCPNGPGAAGCATVSGSNVMDMPWLTSPAQTVANSH
jgi:parallel beta-helix repeat protein